MHPTAPTVARRRNIVYDRQIPTLSPFSDVVGKQRGRL